MAKLRWLCFQFLYRAPRSRTVFRQPFFLPLLYWLLSRLTKEDKRPRIVLIVPGQVLSHHTYNLYNPYTRDFTSVFLKSRSPSKNYPLHVVFSTLLSVHCKWFESISVSCSYSVIVRVRVVLKSHQQQLFSELPSPGRSHWVQTSLLGVWKCGQTRSFVLYYIESPKSCRMFQIW